MLPAQIDNAADGVTFVQYMVETLGLAYHPDTLFQVYKVDGLPVYQPGQADRLNRLADDAHDALERLGLDMFLVSQCAMFHHGLHPEGFDWSALEYTMEFQLTK